MTQPRSGHQTVGTPAQNGDQNGPPPVRTFKPRRRSLTPARAELFERLAPRFTLEERGPVLELADVFGRAHDVVLDIGFGIADCLLAMAVAERDVDVIG